MVVGTALILLGVIALLVLLHQVLLLRRQWRRLSYEQPTAPELRREDVWAPFVVGPETRAVDIRRQYLQLAHAYHPDHGGDPRVMAQINLVYDRLQRGRHQ